MLWRLRVTTYKCSSFLVPCGWCSTVFSFSRGKTPTTWHCCKHQNLAAFNNRNQLTHNRVSHKVQDEGVMEPRCVAYGDLPDVNAGDTEKCYLPWRMEKRKLCVQPASPPQRDGSGCREGVMKGWGPSTLLPGAQIPPSLIPVVGSVASRWLYLEGGERLGTSPSD